MITIFWRVTEITKQLNLMDAFSHLITSNMRIESLSECAIPWTPSEMLLLLLVRWFRWLRQFTLLLYFSITLSSFIFYSSLIILYHYQRITFPTVMLKLRPLSYCHQIEYANTCFSFYYIHSHLIHSYLFYSTTFS